MTDIDGFERPVDRRQARDLLAPAGNQHTVAVLKLIDELAQIGFGAGKG